MVVMCGHLVGNYPETALSAQGSLGASDSDEGFPTDFLEWTGDLHTFLVLETAECWEE